MYIILKRELYDGFILCAYHTNDIKEAIAYCNIMNKKCEPGVYYEWVEPKELDYNSIIENEISGIEDNIWYSYMIKYKIIDKAISSVLYNDALKDRIICDLAYYKISPIEKTPLIANSIEKNRIVFSPTESVITFVINTINSEYFDQVENISKKCCDILMKKSAGSKTPMIVIQDMVDNPEEYFEILFKDGE